LAYFRNIVNDPTAEIMAVVKSTDGDAATYKINGMEAVSAVEFRMQSLQVHF
jgi:hypothetical protein